MDGFVGLTLLHHVAAELAGHHYQRPVEHAALLQIEHQLRNGAIDGHLHMDELFMPPFVGVPIKERNVLGRDFDISGSCLSQTPSQQTAQTKALKIGLLINALAIHVAT